MLARFFSTKGRKASKIPRLTKRLGQHLLINEKILDTIADAGQIMPEDAVLEIGPGTGNLTSRLLDSPASKVIGVEYDNRMIKSLSDRFSSSLRLEVIQADVAKLDVLPSFDVCVANIPYQISSKLLTMLLSHPLHFKCAVLLMQEEFAARLLATPGSSNYSRLSVNIQLQTESIESIVAVPPSDFLPPPKVNSRVIRLRRKARQSVVDFKALDAMLRICFHRKNRTLRAAFTSKSAQALIQTSSDNPKALTEHVLNESSSLSTRAVKMTPDEFVALYEAFSKNGISFTV